MADFYAVVRRAVDGLTENTPEMRALVYEKARGAVLRQLENMNPRPPESMSKRQLEKLDGAIQSVEDEYAGRSYFTAPVDPIEVFQDDLAQSVLEEAAVVPDEPQDEPGVTFELGDDGKLKIAHTGIPSHADWLAIGTLRLGLWTAVDDLIALAIGSNTYSHIGKLAQRYRDALGEREEDDLSVDLAYTYGIRLENARQQLEAIHSGELPAGALPVAEALDSVIALNGPLIMSTARGRELVELGNAYAIRPDTEFVYKQLGIRLAERLVTDGKFINRADARELVEINSEIADPANLQRSTQIAHTANTNLLATAARLIVLGTSVGISLVAGQAVLDSATGAGATAELAAFIDRAVPFLLANRGLLLELSSTVGNNLRWLDSFLRWLELQRVALELLLERDD